MRIYHKLSMKLLFFGLLLLLVSFTGTIKAQKKEDRKSQTLSLSLKVTDDAGNPIPKAQIVAAEGMIYNETDENGAVTISVQPTDLVTITASAFEKIVSLGQDLINESTVVLVKSKLFMTSDDNVPLPFVTMKKRYSTGSEVILTSKQLEKYPSTDLRNAFTGLVNGMEVREFDGSSGFSSEEKQGRYRITDKINVTARGRNMSYIVDNMPIDITEMPLDPNEIGSVTIIKDIIGKAMYGPYGADGIILIETKRGKINDRVLNVNIEQGVSIIDRMPGWTNGADYASLNNQARKASLLPEKYSSEDITAYGNNDPYDMYHPSIDFREMMLKNTKAFRRINVSSSGGNDAVQYAAYIGYNGEDDIFKIGSNSDYSRLITRSNFDIKLNDYLDVDFDIDGTLTVRRAPNYGYGTTEGSSVMDVLELSSVLADINSIPPVAFPIYANYDANKLKWYGVSNDYKFNPIGNLVGNGSYSETGRQGNTNVALNFDMGHMIKGLKSKTGLGFNVNNVLRIGNALDYIAYIATPSINAATGNDTILLSKSHDGVSTSNLSKLHDFYTQRLTAYENLNYERSFGIHAIQSGLTFNITRTVTDAVREPQRLQNLVWNGNYTYNDKISVQAVLNYAGTSSFDIGKRFALFPSLGLSWIISEESFMSGLKFLDYLKLRGQAGSIGYETFFSPFYYRDNWSRGTGANFGPSSLNQWFGSTTGAPYTANKSRTGNPELTWIERKEYNAGFDALLFHQKLSLEMNYYNQVIDGDITQLYNLPNLTGLSSVLPYFNYNKTRYFGLETGIQFSNNSLDFGYSFGGNFTFQNSERLKFAEPEYRNDYQYRTGMPVDAYFGQKYIGRFASDESILVPQLYDEVLNPGDLKYTDMNGDGFVDDNDMSPIGHTTPRLFYSLNGQARYKNFEITVVGTGRALYDIPLTNSYYWNGWGDNNYSNFVKDNIGGAYPRLSYYRANNNFVNSSFWLVKGGFFKVQNVELAYNLMSVNVFQVIRARGIRLYVRASNLLTITKVMDVDPENINSGITSYPLYKTFSGGIKLTF